MTNFIELREALRRAKNYKRITGADSRNEYTLVFDETGWQVVWDFMMGNEIDDIDQADRMIKRTIEFAQKHGFQYE